MNICIFGASGSSLEPVYYEQAEMLGALMAKHGHTLVFGGGREGLMGAAARGVHAEGGKIIGIAPKFFDEPGILYEECSEMIFTDTLRERKQLMEEKSEATIVPPGGIGTYELGRTDRAIVIVNTNGYYEPMRKLLEATAANRFMSESCLELYKLVDTPEQALDCIINYIPHTGSIRRLSDYNK